MLAEYGHVDHDHDWDRADRVFAEDFVFERSNLGLDDLHGIADIVATFKGRNFFAHRTTNVVVTQDGDGTVRARSKLLCFPNEGPPATCDYYDVMVSTPAGWRLGRRRAEIGQRKFFD